MGNTRTDGGSGASTLADLRTVADYQFGAGAGRALFPPDVATEVRRSSSGRPRQVILDPGAGERASDPDPGDGSSPGPGRGRVVSYGVDGRFTLAFEGGRRLAEAFDHPRLRVGVGEESVPFVSEGKNAFAKFVTAVDGAVRPGDEVLVVNDGTLLGVGRAELSAVAMRDFHSGMAVKVREGRED